METNNIGPVSSSNSSNFWDGLAAVLLRGLIREIPVLGFLGLLASGGCDDSSNSNPDASPDAAADASSDSDCDECMTLYQDPYRADFTFMTTGADGQQFEEIDDNRMYTEGGRVLYRSDRRFSLRDLCNHPSQVVVGADSSRIEYDGNPETYPDLPPATLCVGDLIDNSHLTSAEIEDGRVGCPDEPYVQWGLRICPNDPQNRRDLSVTEIGVRLTLVSTGATEERDVLESITSFAPGAQPLPGLCIVHNADGTIQDPFYEEGVPPLTMPIPTDWCDNVDAYPNAEIEFFFRPAAHARGEDSVGHPIAYPVGIITPLQEQGE